MIFRIFTWLGTICSIIALFGSLRPERGSLSGPQGAMAGIMALGILILFFLDLQAQWKLKPRAFTTRAQINSYMHNWIRRGGRVALFTRDMSWAGEERIKKLLQEKSRRGELCICLPSRIPLTDELEREGAEIISYEQLNYIPQSRFTIINKDRMDAHVAVGRRIGEKHFIEEFSAGQHPVLAIAIDLVNIVERLAKVGEKGSTT